MPALTTAQLTAKVNLLEAIDTDTKARIAVLESNMIAQGERDATNAANLLTRCNEIATTARDAIANLTAVVDGLEASNTLLMSRITNLENDYTQGVPEADVEITGEEVNLMGQASMIKLAYFNRDATKMALFGEIMLQLKMRLDELLPIQEPEPTPEPTPTPEPPPKSPDGTQP